MTTTPALFCAHADVNGDESSCPCAIAGWNVTDWFDGLQGDASERDGARGVVTR
jgi:hypothetical protein